MNITSPLSEVTSDLLSQSHSTHVNESSISNARDNTWVQSEINNETGFISSTNSIFHPNRYQHLIEDSNSDFENEVQSAGN